MGRRVGIVLAAAIVILLICCSGRVGGIRGTTVMGSKPPSCERRCGGSCRQCEAIQVPTTGGGKKNYYKHSSSSSSWWRWWRAAGTTSGRGDDDNYSSNYKPMSWKCKCGNLIFDP